MLAKCIACRATVKVRRLRGKAPCCGYYNSLIKAPSVQKPKEKK